ncbi:MAG: hypothetical protein ACRERV_07705, partial [Methylococcales bacterium]
MHSHAGAWERDNYRGHSVRLSAVYPDGSEEALLSVPNYQFQWQTSYQLKTPKPMPAGTQIRVDAEFDNSAKNPLNPNPDQEVRWGQLSDNEMLVAYLMYTTSRKSVSSEPVFDSDQSQNITKIERSIDHVGDKTSRQFL